MKAIERFYKSMNYQQLEQIAMGDYPWIIYPADFGVTMKTMRKQAREAGYKTRIWDDESFQIYK